MPPKRKAVTAKHNDPAKRLKMNTKESNGNEGNKNTQMQNSRGNENAILKVDPHLGLMSRDGQVYEDYDCMLHQTDAVKNTTKFYIIQAIEWHGKYYCWTRWGRQGTDGDSYLIGPHTVDEAIKIFKKKFQEKTMNKWEGGANFEPKSGKYVLIQNTKEPGTNKMSSNDGHISTNDESKSSPPSRIEGSTQNLIELIFGYQMFSDAMEHLHVDVDKLPPIQLTRTLISKGYEVLEEIELALAENNESALSELSSKFYSVISYKLNECTCSLETIDNEVRLQTKYDMLEVLEDIEIAQSLLKGIGEATMNIVSAEAKYRALGCELTLLNKLSDDFKMLQSYTDMTKQKSGVRGRVTILDAWKVNRHGETERLSQHSDIKYRRLLWHGTTIERVASILNSGIRIRKHTSGCYGKGIYHSAMNGKAICFTSGVRDGDSAQIACMFVNEVVLGKEQILKHPDSSLTSPLLGHDSVVYLAGRKRDVKKDKLLQFDGNAVGVPSKIEGMSDYVVYKESQVHLRYIVKIRLG